MTPHNSLWTPDEASPITLPYVMAYQGRHPTRRWDAESRPAPVSAPAIAIVDPMLWTAEQDAELIRRYLANESLQAIADTMNETYNRICGRLCKLRRAGKVKARPQITVHHGHKLPEWRTPKQLLPLPFVVPPPPVVRDVIDVSAGPVDWPPEGLTLPQIAAAVARHYGISKVDFMSARREEKIVRARHVYFWLAKHSTSKSFAEIGRKAGDKDHSTVMHGIEKVDERMAVYQGSINAIKRTLGLRTMEADSG